ncbi:hypothetical protein [Diaphorobacter sp.]|uniref:hypothetical protein n=1 Tax=Diaphorobacter sp. TaxID=1934310 RepID=UPI0028A8E1A9|nr:hypothetical protein [Diaphorobacter sp.]
MQWKEQGERAGSEPERVSGRRLNSASVHPPLADPSKWTTQEGDCGIAQHSPELLPQTDLGKQSMSALTQRDHKRCDAKLATINHIGTIEFLACNPFKGAMIEAMDTSLNGRENSALDSGCTSRSSLTCQVDLEIYAHLIYY